MTAETGVSVSDTRQFRLGYLFFVTMMIALGLGLSARASHPAIQGIGLSIVLFWVSRGIFAVSKLMPKVAREILFLLGLPLFIGAIQFLLWALIIAVFDLVPFLSP